MLDTNALQSFLRANPDADLAAVQAAAVVRTPRTTFVTYQTIANVWDQQTAATFIAKLAAGVAQGFSLAILVDKLLLTGFDPANGKAAAVAAQLVAAGLCTTDQADAVLLVTAHPFGDVPTEDDVAAAQLLIAALDHRADLYTAVDARLARLDTKAAYARKVLTDYRGQLDAGEMPTPPTDEDVLAAFVAGGIE